MQNAGKCSGHWMPMGLALAATLLVAALLRRMPEEPCRIVFREIPARLAAGYYGAALEGGGLVFAENGVALEVARACAATDFFAMAAGVLAWGCARGRRRAWPWLLLLPTAWCVTLLANTARLIALVPATGWMRALLPPSALATGHQAAGTAVFLLALAAVHALSMAALWAGDRFFKTRRGSKP